MEDVGWWGTGGRRRREGAGIAWNKNRSVRS
jgi:hypothetical protein